MTILKTTARISVAIIIILLGLTVIAPEWLELKDMMLSDHRVQNPSNEELGIAPSHIVDETKDYLANVGASLYQRVIGQEPNLNGWWSNLFNGIWHVYNVIKTLIFIIFTFLLFLAINDALKRIYKPVTKATKGIFYLITLIISFSSSLFVWPYLGAIIMSIAKLFSGVFA
ncbi:MAG: hypothetical protein L3J51_04195 [Cocleimonas sp.]|nr:hypothetical protein [Cocleimonas sp.]